MYHIEMMYVKNMFMIECKYMKYMKKIKNYNHDIITRYIKYTIK